MSFSCKLFPIFILFVNWILFPATDSFGQEVTSYPGNFTIKNPSPALFEFPEFVIESSEQSAHGYYLFDLSPYIAIIDHYGNPLFYHNIPGGSRNFERHSNGSYSYYANSVKGFLVMNEYFQITDTFVYVNGELIDFHEFNILGNGNYIVLGYDRRVVDMSQYVEGGKPYATVTGMIFQELDPEKNILFEWNSWDHISFMDSDTFFVYFESHSLDYMHSNSIVIDHDGHYLVSSRHLSEITKIDRSTGEIIWRMGGTQNEFDFINDTLGFSGLHSAFRMANGNIALLDNGNGHVPQFSRGIEYEIDEVEKKAYLIRDCRELPITYSAVMGNVTPLPGNHLVVGWGKNNNDHYITEFNEEGQKVTGIYPTPGEVYSSYKVSYLNQFSFFVTTDIDSLDFGIVNIGESVILYAELFNTGPDPATLFSLSDESSQFGIADSLPVVINSGESRKIALEFQPTDPGNYHIPAYLNFRLDSTITEEHLIACRIMLYGFAPPGLSISDSVDDNEISIYPNPFHNRIVVEHSSDIKSLIIWSMTGKKVFQVQNINRKRLVLDQGHLDAGIYLVEVTLQDDNRKFVKVVKGRR